MPDKWTHEEDAVLAHLVSLHGRQWGLISSQMKDRSPSQVAARWEKCLDPKLLKGAFTHEEDCMIVDYVEKNGPKNWPLLAQAIVRRSPKQLRERWCNHLDPSISHVRWSPEEDMRLFGGYEAYGPKWSLIARMLPGRTDNSIKNRWHSSIQKRLSTDESGQRALRPEPGYRLRKSSTIGTAVSKVEAVEPERRQPPPPPPDMAVETRSAVPIEKENEKEKEPPAKLVSAAVEREAPAGVVGGAGPGLSFAERMDSLFGQGDFDCPFY